MPEGMSYEGVFGSENRLDAAQATGAVMAGHGGGGFLGGLMGSRSAVRGGGASPASADSPKAGPGAAGGEARSGGGRVDPAREGRRPSERG